MSILTAGTVTVTAPASVDGRGEVATLNNTASGTFVGYLFDRSGFGGASVRTSLDNITEGHGATAGSQFYGPRSFTLTVEMARASTYALSDARYNKLCRSWDAMAADASLVWFDSDGYTKLLSFRTEQSPGDPGSDGLVLLGGVAPDPRIYNNTPQTGSSPKTNNGTAGSHPTFTLTPTGGSVVITNTTAGLGSPAVTLLQGTGYLATGSAVTVDFYAGTVTQGGVGVQQAVSFPGSTWWEVVPSANTWTVTNASSVSISFRDAWRSG